MKVAGSLAVLVSVAMLSSCSISHVVELATGSGSPATINAADVVGLAVDSIRENAGAEVSIDCGTAEVPFAVGTVLDCEGVDAGSTQVIPVRIAITLVDGDYYEIDISSDGPAAAEPDAGAGADSGFVSSADFQDVVADALESATGERGAVNCGPDDVEVFLGAQLVCAVVLPSGFAETLVTVTAFDGSTYEISAELVE